MQAGRSLLLCKVEPMRNAFIGEPVEDVLAWVDRSGGLFDTLDSPPEITVSTLIELADTLEVRRG